MLDWAALLENASKSAKKPKLFPAVPIQNATSLQQAVEAYGLPFFWTAMVTTMLHLLLTRDF